MKIHFHNWAKWGVVIRHANGNGYQYRRCKNCGMIDVRIVHYIVGMETKDINDSVKE